jgi:hypothetical protein
MLSLVHIYIQRISKSAAQLKQPPVAEPGSTYQEWKDELTSKSKNLAGVMRNIVTVDKSNVVLIANAAREVAELIPSVVEAVRQACAHTTDNAVKSQVPHLFVLIQVICFYIFNPFIGH